MGRGDTVNFKDVSCPFYDSKLEAKTYAQERCLLFTSVFNSQDHALRAAVTKSARNKDTATRFQRPTFTPRKIAHTQHLQLLAMHRDIWPDCSPVFQAPGLKTPPTVEVSEMSVHLVKRIPENERG